MAPRPLDILWFAWLRERAGTGRDRVETAAPTLAALAEELRGLSEGHALALSDLRAVRAAVDQRMVAPEAWADTPLDGVREVAFFPPMTGG